MVCECLLYRIYEKGHLKNKKKILILCFYFWFYTFFFIKMTFFHIKTTFNKYPFAPVCVCVREKKKKHPFISLFP
jgi:hypothetical protein